MTLKQAKKIIKNAIFRAKMQPGGIDYAVSAMGRVLRQLSYYDGCALGKWYKKKFINNNK